MILQIRSPTSPKRENVIVILCASGRQYDEPSLEIDAIVRTLWLHNSCRKMLSSLYVFLYVHKYHTHLTYITYTQHYFLCLHICCYFNADILHGYHIYYRKYVLCLVHIVRQMHRFWKNVSNWKYLKGNYSSPILIIILPPKMLTL